MSDSHLLEPEDFSSVEFNLSNNNELTIDKLNLETIEKLALQKALAKYSGNISKAAKELGLTRTSLYRRMEKYGL